METTGDFEMTKEQLARQLNGRQIGEEISDSEAENASKAGLVVVFGSSDDLVELRGAIFDKVGGLVLRPTGVYEGTELLIDKEGVLKRDQIDDDELEAYFSRKKGKLSKIQALWCDDETYSWSFKTDIPHAVFDVIEDSELFCRGIVFSMSDLSCEC
jgi:hypothetical protein